MLTAFAVCSFLVFPFITCAEETIIAAVTLNSRPKGDFFVILLDDGDFLIRTGDLTAMGLTRIPGVPVEREGDTYISLRSADELVYQFDEERLVIDISSAPVLLGRTTLDLAAADRTGVLYPEDDSLFLNYGVDYKTLDNDFESATLTLTNELGIRFRDVLLLTDTIYKDDAVESNFLRLNTRLIHDNRNTLRRFVAGDFFATSGTLGSQLNLGGLSLSKVYDIDPYVINYPLFDFSGQLPLPSEVEVYLGGTKLRSERLEPGVFNLENLYGINGDQTVEIVIRDAFGREQKILHPFYFTDRLLRRGLHEYSYNLGWIRTDFGQSSNSYSVPALSALHRYGVTDFFNLGWRGEGKTDLVNMGLESTFKLGHLGLLRLDASTSRYHGSGGTAGQLSYEYLNRSFRAQLALQRFSDQYRTLGDTTTDDPKLRKLSFRGGLGYSTPLLGSLGLDYSRTQYFEQQARETISLTWSRRVMKHSYLNTTLRQVREEVTANEAFLTLTYYFGDDYSLAASYRHDKLKDVQAIEMLKSTPVGEGTGWNLRAERTETEVSEDTLASTDIQHNARHAILRGSYRHGRQDANSEENLRVAMSGAVVHLGGTTDFTRPVNDSYGLVKVGEAGNVKVLVNGQVIGSTNQLGEVIVPKLNSYYENEVSFDDKDLPIEYIMPQVRLKVSPPQRSGSCYYFPLKRYQAFTGIIALDGPQGRVPLSNAALQLQLPNRSVSFWTGGEGEFYLDDQQEEFDIMPFQGCDVDRDASVDSLRAGTYPLSVQMDGQSFEAQLTIPESTEPYVDMGEVVLKLPPAPVDPM